MKLMEKQREIDSSDKVPKLATDQDVLRSLRRIFHAVDRYSRRLARFYGLTGPQAIALRAIDRAAEVNPGQLARLVSLSPPTVSGILDRLERRGLVRRDRSSRDKRQVVVCLTDEGQHLLARSPPPLQEQFTARLAELPVTRQQRIAGSLREVVRLLEAEDIDAAPLLALGAANSDQPVEIPS